MSLFLAKKQEDANQKKVRDLLRLKENKKCFDCPTKSPAFVNTTIQTFICSRCSGLVREVGHRVKAVSASKFSGAEVLALKHGGNGIALKIWLSNYSTHGSPEPETDGDVRAFMRQKYYENKWLDRALLQSHKEKVRDLLAKNFTEDGLPIVAKSRAKFSLGFARLPLIADSEMNIMHDDDDDYEEEKLEPVHHTAVASPPQQKAPAPYMNSHVPVGPQMTLPSPPTATNASVELGRASMESSYSGYSCSSKSQSAASVHSSRGSQDMTRMNDGAVQTPTTSVGSAHGSLEAPSSTSTSMVLTAEQIAERCKSTMGSDSPEAKAIAAAQLLAEQQKLEQEQYQQQQLQYQMHSLQQHQYPQQLPYQQQPYPLQQPLQQLPHYQQQPHQQLPPYQQQPYQLQLQQPYPLHQQQLHHVEEQQRFQSVQPQVHNQQCVEAVPTTQDPYSGPISQTPYTSPSVQGPFTAPITQASCAVPEQRQTTIAGKSLPPLRIDVPRANKDMIYNKHSKNNQAKSPSSVGSTNNVQSPTTIPGIESASASPVVTPSTSKVKSPASPFDSILSDLAGLKLEKTVRQATYTGGMLSPAAPAISPLTPSNSTNASKTKQDETASIFDHDFFSKLNKASEQKPNPENDPYAALRGIPAPVVATPEAIKEDEKNTSSSSEEEDDDDWQEFCSSSVSGEHDDFAAPSQLVQPTTTTAAATAAKSATTNMISVDLFSDLDPRSMFKRF